MTFCVIDTDGQLHTREQRPTLAAINAEVGQPGMAMVRLTNARNLYAFVNDEGLVAPELPRNPVGACVIAVLGANMAQPYAGPIVITGWHPHDEMVDLPAEDVAGLVSLIADVRRVLAGHWTNRGEDWDRQVRQYAAFVAEGPAPQVQVVHVDDFNRTGGAL